MCRGRVDCPRWHKADECSLECCLCNGSGTSVLFGMDSMEGHGERVCGVAEGEFGDTIDRAGCNESR